MTSKEMLILIPARGGSTRVKNKNLRLLGGKPLLHYTVAAGLKSAAGRVVVSTNDKRIAEAARRAGAEVPFMRPENISTAGAPSVAVIHHALAWFKQNEGWQPEIVAFCPPTNPFRSGKTIRAMRLRLKSRKNINSIVTITKPATHPFTILKKNMDGRCQSGIIEIDGKTLHDIERSQDWPIVWEGSPACRMTRVEFFLQHKNNFKMKTYDVRSFLGFEVSPFEAMDIDDEDDFYRAELLMKQIKKEKAQ